MMNDDTKLSKDGSVTVLAVCTIVVAVSFLTGIWYFFGFGWFVVMIGIVALLIWIQMYKNIRKYAVEKAKEKSDDERD